MTKTKRPFPREVYTSELRTGTLLDPETGRRFIPSRIVGIADIKVALHDQRTVFVLLNNPSSATDGSFQSDALQWYRTPTTYSIWKATLQEHIVPSQQVHEGFYLDDYADELCFIASEWRCDDGSVAVFFERKH